MLWIRRSPPPPQKVCFQSMNSSCNRCLLHLLAFQVCVPQLQVDGGRKRRLPRASAGLHPPGLSGLRRHLDEAGGQFRQAQTHQQRTGRPGTRKGHFLFIFTTVLLKAFTCC